MSTKKSFLGAVWRVYREGEEDNAFSCACSLSVLGLGGYATDKIRFFGTLAHSTSDSNIDFYTTEISMGVLVIMYRL